MSLREYKDMRNFRATPEPAGSTKAKHSKKLEFVVQKHQASRLHYDFRLELGGVLKSWAIPKGPSLNPEEKRLAMMVEDHPYEYRTFEGVIPEGNYGAGNVIIWDRGWYSPAQTLHGKVSAGEPMKNLSLEEQQKMIRAGLKKGDFKFILHGQKLKGAYVLVKTKGWGENAWLLIKKDDKYVSRKDITKDDKSVVSGRTVTKLGDQNSTESRESTSESKK